MSSLYKVKFNREMILDAAQAYEDPLTKNTNEACHFLEVFQKSPQAWRICTDLLRGLTEHKLNVLFLSATILRQKIRDEIKLLSDRQQMELRDELMDRLKCAYQTQREGIEKIKRLISLAIADMGLRMRHWPTMLNDITYELWQSAPLALLQVIQLLGEQPADVEQQQLLTGQADNMMNMLNVIQTHVHLDTVEMWRGCLLCYAAWARGSLLPLSLDQLLDHSVVVQAIALLQHPEMMQRQLYAEASECFSGTVISVASHPESRNPEALRKVRTRIFDITKKFVTTFDELLPEEKLHCAKVYNTLTEVFAGLDPSRDATALIKPGPFCFELQLQVVSVCNVTTVLASLELWQELADQLQSRLEPELFFRYERLVKNFVRSVYRKCRLPALFDQLTDEQMDVMNGFRSGILYLLPKMVNLLGLDKVIVDQMTRIHNPKSTVLDIELALFFITPLLKKLKRDQQQVLEDLMCFLPKLYWRTLYAVPVHKQVILCLTACHSMLDHMQLRHELVRHLVEICKSGNQQLSLSASHAINRLSKIYVDVQQFQPLF